MRKFLVAISVLILAGCALYADLEGLQPDAGTDADVLLPDLHHSDVSVDMTSDGDFEGLDAEFDQGDMSCVVDTQAACDAAERECGSLLVEDSCGTNRTVSCGSCTSPETCSSGRCGCTPESNATLCDGRECGNISVTDRCGMTRNISCGSCPDLATCEEGSCVCELATDLAQACADAQVPCGTGMVEDACGLMIEADCPDTCVAPQTCGGAGTANQCGCTPSCTPGTCNVDDGCGGLCTCSLGTCSTEINLCVCLGCALACRALPCDPSDPNSNCQGANCRN